MGYQHNTGLRVGDPCYLRLSRQWLPNPLNQIPRLLLTEGEWPKKQKGPKIEPFNTVRNM